MPVLLLIISSLMLVGCRTAPPAATAAAAPAGASRLTVAVQVPQRRGLQSDASLTGEFRPYQQVDLYAKVAGYLRKIEIDVGSRVRSGEVIAQLDSPELQAEVEQAVAGRKRAESELTRAQAEVPRFDAAVALAKTSAERLQNVNRAEAGLVAQQEIDVAQARLRDAESHVAAARAQVLAATQQVDAARASEVRARSMLDYTKITAPFSGLVMKRYADPGALIQAGIASSTQALPLIRLADVERLRLVANVPEAIAGLVKPGGTVEVRVPALKQTFTARFSRFTSNVQQASRTTEVEIDVQNASRAILPGMVADVTLKVESRPDVLTIPVQSFANLGGNRFVLVVNESGVLEERQIKTGMESAAEVEVVAGLTGGEKVVTSSRTMLRPGMHVDAKLEGASR